MATQFRSTPVFVSVIAAIAVLGSANAHALEFKNISGKWCTTGGSEQFNRNTLIAVPSSNRKPLIYKITKYEFTDTKVVVYWIGTSGKHTSTDFGAFSADGQGMVQLLTKEAPERAFHRCK